MRNRRFLGLFPEIVKFFLPHFFWNFYQECHHHRVFLPKTSQNESEFKIKKPGIDFLDAPEIFQ